jgi:hypothetical protein
LSITDDDPRTVR